MKAHAHGVGAWAALVGVALVGASGCAVSPCSEPQSPNAAAPELSTFTLDSQMETDPWTVIFAAVFIDGNGDLGTGRAEFFLNGRASDTKVDLAELFRQSSLPLDAKDGTFAIPLRFSDTVSNGATVKLGVQLVDGADLRSNCYALELNFAVQPVAGRRVDCRALAQAGAQGQIWGT